MRKKPSVAPSATNPIADFLKKLPHEATVLGCRMRRSPKQSEFTLAYLSNDSVFYVSITTKGGIA